MDTLIIRAESSKTKALIGLLEAFEISFEVKKSKEKPYDEKFVEMVLEASKGKRKRINPDNVWESIM